MILYQVKTYSKISDDLINTLRNVWFSEVIEWNHLPNGITCRLTVFNMKCQFLSWSNCVFFVKELYIEDILHYHVDKESQELQLSVYQLILLLYIYLKNWINKSLIKHIVIIVLCPLSCYLIVLHLKCRIRKKVTSDISGQLINLKTKS